MLARQRAGLKSALIELRQTAGGARFIMRGMDAVLSTAVIEKVVKQCNKICSEEDVVFLGVVKEFSRKVFQLVELHIPRTVHPTSSAPAAFVPGALLVDQSLRVTNRDCF